VRHFCDLDDAEQAAISLAVAERVIASGAADLEELAAKEGKSRLVLWAEIAVLAMAKKRQSREVSGVTDLHVKVRGSDIVVTLPGTAYRVVYYRPAASPRLLTKEFPAKNDRSAPMKVVTFLASAREARQRQSA